MNVHEPTSDDVTNTVASVEIETLGPIFDGELVDDKPAKSYERPHAGRNRVTSHVPSHVSRRRS